LPVSLDRFRACVDIFFIVLGSVAGFKSLRCADLLSCIRDALPLSAQSELR
jgi:hypothetical protein